MARWPELPLIVLKGISLACFAGAFALEVLDYISLKGVYNSHCIAGFEVTDEIGFHIIILWCTIIADCVYILCVLASFSNALCTFGTDPTAAGYHLIAGFLLFITIIKVVAIESCGNDAMSTILGVPGSVGVVAVILHIVGGAVCLAFLPKAERTLSLPRRAWSVPD